MKLTRGLHNLRPSTTGCVATIGNFDGVHLGHQAVLRQLIARARTLNLPACVITFEPQPMEFFAPEAAPARLTRLREKLRAIAACGIEHTVVLEFGARLANLDATTFAQQLLLEALAVRHLMVGDDFRFGRERSGDITLLKALGDHPPAGSKPFQVEPLATFMLDGARVSSTRVRMALQHGDLRQAERLLGRPYCIEGRVGHGDERGRSIGFPTLNLSLHRQVSPLRGVFAVQVHGLGEHPRPGVANIGTRPTVDGYGNLLEVHLFDFDRMVYGQHLRVEFRRKLREEQKFASFEELKVQIHQDAAAARAALAMECNEPSAQDRTGARLG